ncbi:MAG: hypothetical protein ABI626_06890 [Sphingomicrobium sp.]
MAKFVLAVPRRAEAGSIDLAEVERACAALAPDDLALAVHAQQPSAGVMAAILNPSPAVRIEQSAIGLGAITDNGQPWSEPGGAVPDGSFVIARWNEAVVELLSDVVATRTAWWVLTDDYFLASSSQRAIVRLLGDFQFNRQVIPWMLSCGTLGPASGWDSRLNRLGPDTRLVLDRAEWTVEASTRPVAFAASPGADDAQLVALEQALSASAAALALDGLQWRLPLSGGYDSRFILTTLHASGVRPQSITWGRAGAPREKGSDAFVAAQLAERLDCPHEYFDVGASPEPVEAIVERFLHNGEGRVDHVAGYLDGFAIWKTLFGSNIELVLRGDEAFGWSAVSSEREVRKAIELLVLEDYFPSAKLAELGLEANRVPAEFERATGESLPAWRDRLYQTVRIPTVLAALSDLKLAYLEIANPLISRRVVEVVRATRDDLRTDKALFSRIVERVGPAVAFAKFGALEESDKFLNRPDVRQLMLDDIAGADFGEVLSPQLAAHLRHALAGKRTGSSRATGIKRWLKSVAPTRAIAWLKRRRTKGAAQLDSSVLAWRACMVVRMHRILTRDAAAGGAGN